MVSLSDNNQAAVIEAFDSASRLRQFLGQIKNTCVSGNPTLPKFTGET